VRVTQSAPVIDTENVNEPDGILDVAPRIARTASQEGLLDRLLLLWNERRFLMRSTVIGLVIGTAFAFLLPKKYDSTTELMPPDNQSNTALALMAGLSAKGGGGIGALAGDFLGLKSSGSLFIGILRSRTVEDHLIDTFDLRRVYRTRYEETARKILAENTSISEDRKSGIISIMVTDADPNRATAMAKAYVTELDNLVAKVSTSSARREREFLEERLKAVQTELQSAEKDFSQFASKNTAIDIKEQGRAMVDAAATLEGQLIAAKSELEGLRRIYAPGNVRVLATQGRIDELQRQLERLGGKDDAKSGNSSDSDSLYPSIRKLPLLGVTFADLYRRTRVQEAVFEVLTQQYELAKVEEAKETPTVKVLDEARVPEKKSFPPRLLIMCTCAFLAFGCACVICFGKTRWSEMDSSNPAKVLATQVLHSMNAYVPWTSPNGSGRKTMANSVWTRLRRNGSPEQIRTEDHDGRVD
jgi:uncharacterized protein involved in exopolysaccharide biosynthesis